MFKKYCILLGLSLLLMNCEHGDDFNGNYTEDYGSYEGGDRYNIIEENPFVNVSEQPVSTFSIDADGASYAIVRNFINRNQLPPKDAVRTEELINYFDLAYPENNGDLPLFFEGEVSQCPWTPGNKLIRIGVKGKSVPRNELPPSNFVFLIDVSGSMSSADKLDLLKQGFSSMVDELTGSDRIAIVTYAGSAEVLLPSTSGDQKSVIKSAIDQLGAGGSTAGAQGIITAYDIAKENFIEGGNNRVILGTDGDFNVGVSSQDELVALIEEKRELGIFLTTIGVGHGNLNDGMLEQVADKGNGTYEYIDNLEQAKKVFIYEFNKFYPAAKDVKIQVEFNPTLVEAYRLIGYENRLLSESDFENDSTDAGEISIGQNITAFYEIKPASNLSSALVRSVPTFTIKSRYKKPDAEVSEPHDFEIFDSEKSFDEASENMIFTGSVAGFGMLLRNSEYRGTLTYDDILVWTSNTLTYDPHNFREEFRELVQRVKGL